MSEEFIVLKDVCARLEQAKIFYMITGSIAGTVYATPRMTRDIDVVIQVQQQHIAQLLGAFQNDYYIDEGMATEAVRTRGMFNIIHNEYLVKVDFVVQKLSDYRTIEFQRRRRMTIDGQVCWVVAPEDLVLSKLVWAKESRSAMQLNDVRSVLHDVPDLDRSYLEQWLDALGVRQAYEGLLP